MWFSLSSITSNLTKPTSFFGLKLWVAIIICIALLIVLILLIFISCRRRKKPHFGTSRPIISNNFCRSCSTYSTTSMDRRLLSSRNGWEIEMGNSDHWSGTKNADSVAARRGKRYTPREIEAATNGFADENVIGSGDYGIVYRGVLLDNRRVAVKKLMSDSDKVEEFMEEMEAMCSVRHRNLVKLLGCCTGGTYRMLVYEYVDNGNLQQWLHGWVGQVSPLTWEIRMNIILGTAKGLAYLHDTEPGFVHQHIKSSNILFDHQWNPKISDFGVAKLLGPGWSPMGMSGYIAPEYACSGVLDEKSDVYSFGILIMEIISRKAPIKVNGTGVKAYLVDWLKSMVANQNFDQVVDLKLPEMPSLKELKRILLIALRCVDPDVENRPKMGDVIHMLEPRDLLLTDELVIRRETSCIGSSR